MRALTVERYGDKAGVRAGEVPDPEVGAARTTRWSGFIPRPSTRSTA